MLTKRPDLFAAVISIVPLLDMIRYSQLLAGASWMAEYGNPEEQDMREYLLSYSPYHNMKKELHYPPTLLMTSTKDDRVHPGHARRMAYKMIKQGHSPVFYYENIEGGHKGTGDLDQLAIWHSLTFEFLFKTLFDGAYESRH